VKSHGELEKQKTRTLNSNVKRDYEMAEKERWMLEVVSANTETIHVALPRTWKPHFTRGFQDFLLEGERREEGGGRIACQDWEVMEISLRHNITAHSPPIWPRPRNSAEPARRGEIREE